MAKKPKKALTTKTPKGDIAKYISVYQTRSGEAEKYQDIHELVDVLKKKPKRAVKFLKYIFDFGFIMNDQTYYIRADGILGKHWTHGLETVIEKTEKIPRVYNAINNILAEVQLQMEHTKTEHASWAGSMWDLKRIPEHGLYDATNARMTAFIDNQSEGIDLRNLMSELKAIVTKLKGLLIALTMQHQTAIAILYQSKRTSDIFQDAVGSMMNRVIDGSLDAESEAIADFTTMDEAAQNAEESAAAPKKKKKKKRGRENGHAIFGK